MDYNKIKISLSKYMDGESSLAEEQELNDYFQNTETIPQEFAYAKAMFGQFKQEQEIIYSPKKKHSTLTIKIAAVAASIALMVGIALHLQNTNDEVIYGYINGKPITDEAIAIEEVQSALNLVSQNYNRGTKELNKLSKFHKTKQLIMGIDN